MNNIDLDKELVHSIAMTLIDNEWTKQEYMVLITQNDWITDATIDYIEQHIDKAVRLITVAAKRHHKEMKDKHKALEPQSIEAASNESTNS